MLCAFLIIYKNINVLFCLLYTEMLGNMLPINPPKTIRTQRGLEFVKYLIVLFNLLNYVMQHVCTMIPFSAFTCINILNLHVL